MHKRAELAHELAGVLREVQKLRLALGQVDATLRLLDASYKPTVTRRGWLPHGDAARLALVVLKESNAGLTTPTIANRIAQMRSLTFKHRLDAEDFASSVAMALRRYERRGLVRLVGERGPHMELCWQLPAD
jgi:hypothetical protein